MKVCTLDHSHTSDWLHWSPNYKATPYSCVFAYPVNSYAGADRQKAEALAAAYRPHLKVCLSDHEHSRICPITGADWIKGTRFQCAEALCVDDYCGDAKPKAEALIQDHPLVTAAKNT